MIFRKGLLWLKEELSSLQVQCYTLPFDDAIHELEREALLKYSELVVVEEGFHRQKSRVQWLALGDQNSKFFHKKVKSHIVRSKILSISYENGNRLEEPAATKTEILGFYKKLLGEKFNLKMSSAGVMSSLVTSKVPVHMKDGLIQDVTTEEIKRAMFAIGGDKAPGPDGFSASFFHKNWSIVGPDVVNAVTYFFSHKCLPKGWNATAFTLVPKLSCPLTMKDYRPIACCNVIYKCITKLLALRLQPILPHLIDQSQAVFVKGRSISDNILLMQELVRNYHRNALPKRSAVNIDLMKAYDSVDWEFLFDVMHAMDFP